MKAITAARDRILAGSVSALSTGELLAALDAAPLAGEEITTLAWQTPAELAARGIKPRQAASVAAAFELLQNNIIINWLKSYHCKPPLTYITLFKFIAFKTIFKITNYSSLCLYKSIPPLFHLNLTNPFVLLCLVGQ